MNDNQSLSILRKKGFCTLADLVGVLPQHFTAVTPKKVNKSAYSPDVKQKRRH